MRASLPLRVRSLATATAIAVAFVLLMGSTARAADERYVGSYRTADGKLSILLTQITGEADGYFGMLQFAGQQLPFVGKLDARGLAGKFDSGGASFDLRAVAGNGKLVIETGGKTYDLSRGDPAPVANVPAKRKDGLKLPEQYKVMANEEFGRTLLATYDGARSASDLLSSTAKDLGGYFDAKPKLAAAFGDKDDHTATTSFSALAGGRPIRGAIFTTVGPKGATAAVVYAVEDASPKVFSRLLAAVPTAGKVKWQSIRIPDGTGSLRLPEEWTVNDWGNNGSVSIAGPEGQRIDLGISYTILSPRAGQDLQNMQAQLGKGVVQYDFPIAPYGDPVQAVQSLAPYFSRQSVKANGPPSRIMKIVEATPQEYPNGKAAMIHLIVEVGEGAEATSMHVLATVICSPIDADHWQYYFSQIVAPQGVFQRDMGTMMQIWGSWRIDPRVFKERFDKAMAGLREANQIYQETQQNASLMRDRQAADIGELIRGYRTVEDTRTGDRTELKMTTIDKAVEKLNEHEGYERYKQIPLRDEVR